MPVPFLPPKHGTLITGTCTTEWVPIIIGYEEPFNMKGFVMKTAGFFLSAALLLSACASPSPSPDAQLNSRIKQDIARTEGIGNASGVNVESSRGIVVLTGFLESEQQKRDAAQTALKVSGVQQVFNNIQVLKPTSSGQ